MKKRNESTPLGDKLRLLAAPYAGTGDKARAEGLMQAADIVDGELTALTGKALVDALRVMVRAELEEFVADVVAAVRSEDAPPAASSRPRRGGMIVGRGQARIIERPATPARPRASSPTPSDMPTGELRCLVAIAQHAPGPVTREQLTALTGYKRSTRDLYLQSLARRGYVTRDVHGIRVTSSGLGVLPAAFEPLPTGKALLEHWLRELPEGERRVLDYVARFYPHPIHRDRVGDTLGYRRSTRDLYLQKLERRRLLEKTGAGHVLARSILFDPPSDEVIAKVARS